MRDKFATAGAAILAVQFYCSSLTAGEKAEIKPSDSPTIIQRGEELQDITYLCQGRDCHLSDFMERVGVCALLVMKGNEQRLARYDTKSKFCQEENQPPLANNDKRLYGIASVTKSLTSTLLAFALLRDSANPGSGIDATALAKPISEIVTRLDKAHSKGAYAGVPIERVLLMRSGASYDEYGSDSDRLRDDVFEHRSLTALAFLQKLRRVSRWFVGPIGSTDGKFNYAGADTQAIGSLVQELSGKKLPEYLWAKLWDPLGMTSRAKWAVDGEGTASAYCCFSATAPDLLRFGKFILDRGTNLRGELLLPPAWFDAATKAVSQTGDTIPPGNASYNEVCPDKAPTQYRYQWWLFPSRTDFTAVGISGQFIHIYPDADLVIVQISGWNDWDDHLACESMDAHAAIAGALEN